MKKSSIFADDLRVGNSGRIVNLEGEAQAEAIITVARGVIVPIGRTTAADIAAPAAATIDPIGARGTAVTITAVIAAVEVGCPFPYIAAHVVDAELVG